uniref:BTB domain-containing protein n=1 Tax=Corethron hystrix TaxID=216773 RepID=A0A7S1FVS7_9STRA
MSAENNDRRVLSTVTSASENTFHTATESQGAPSSFSSASSSATGSIPSATGCVGREERYRSPSDIGAAIPDAAFASSSRRSHASRMIPSVRPSSSLAALPSLVVFTWGRGEDGQLGLGDTSDRPAPTVVEALLSAPRGVSVRSVACGSGHTVVLAEDGTVYTWGRGDDGRLGHGDAGWKYVPRIAEDLLPGTGEGDDTCVEAVTCGSYHSAAVGEKGELYTWGGGMYGKLGHGDEEGHDRPARVAEMEGKVVVAVACGSRHTAALTDRGHLYAWGDRENGVAGHVRDDGGVARHVGDDNMVTTDGATGVGHQYVPLILDRLADKKVIQVSACGFHTACLTNQNDVYTWGEGKFGRLGHGTERNCHGPKLVEALIGRRTKRVVCGGFHSACVTEEGRVYTWGGGEHGQLGHGDKVNKLRPALVTALQGTTIRQITCGWSHSVALTSCGKVYTWGNGDHGKLGHGSKKKMSVPKLIEKLADYRVVDVASYNEHTAALVESSADLLHGYLGGNMVAVTPEYLNSFRVMLNDDDFSDITFIVQGEPIHAHRVILASRSAHFSAMFRSGMRESNQREVIIPDTPRHIFLLLLEFLYTDALPPVAREDAIDLYVAADLYGIERLREGCAVTLRRGLGPENAAVTLQAAEDARCEALKAICMEYIVGNFDIVSKSEGIRAVSHTLLLEILAIRPT